MDFLPEAISTYSEQHTSDDSSLLHQITRETNLNVLKPRMLSGHLQGRVLSMISHMIAPKNILEIGTYTGYSALCMAEGLTNDGQLITIERNEELASKIQHYFNQSAYTSKLHLKIGDAREIIPSLHQTWDLIFIDADKASYQTYFNLTIDHVRSGGFILIDNVLWSGKVAETDKNDKATLSMRAFNDAMHKDQRVENVLLPIRDGIMILRKL
ncbi:MAG: caffeoyl-CoA O-methyltransferase [Cyclobacteriaceae bacterium]|jgi:caffeoyl-CoA O-methyltransferase